MNLFQIKEVKLQHKISELLKNNRGIFLNIDNALEHGTANFNQNTINPEYILKAAKEARFNALIMQKGLAMHYIDHYKYQIPLVLKLNGTFRSKYFGRHHLSTCTVSKAAKIGADAVGYTISFNSVLEKNMVAEFSRIEEEAHENGLPVFVFVDADNKDTDDLPAFARKCMELGADFVTANYFYDKNIFGFAAKSCGNARLLLDVKRRDVKHIFNEIHEAVKSGCKGACIGEQFWNHEKPLQFAEALKSILFGNKKPEYAEKILRR